MKRFFYLFLLAGFVGCTPVSSSPDIVHAAIAPSCQTTWADYRAALRSTPVEEVADPEAFLKAFNAVPDADGRRPTTSPTKSTSTLTTALPWLCWWSTRA